MPVPCGLAGLPTFHDTTVVRWRWTTIETLSEERLSPDDEQPGPTAADDAKAYRDPRIYTYQLPLFIIVGLLVLAPVGFMFWGAFRTGTLANPDAVFTLDKVRAVYATWPHLRLLLFTTFLAASVGAVSTLFGALFAWILSRTDVPNKNFLEIAVLAPLFLSPFVGAVAWLILGSPRAGFINVVANNLFPGVGTVVNTMSLTGIIFVMSLFYIPYAYLFVSTGLRNMDPSMEEASYMSGDGVLRTAARVTFPLVKPGLMSGFFFVFVLSAGLFSIPAVLGASGVPVPIAVEIYRAASVTPQDFGRAAALGTLLFWIALAGIVIYRASTKLSSRFVTVTARGFRPRIIRLGKWRWAAWAVCVAYVFAAIILPNFVLVYVSLTPFISTRIMSASFSLDAIMRMMDNLLVRSAIQNTLTIGVVAPTLTVLLSAMVAFAIHRLRLRGSSLLDYLATLPVAVPGIVFGTGLMWMYIWTPIYGTIWLLVVAYIAGYLPHAVRISSTSLIQIDKNLEEASRMCGARMSETFRRVTLPLIKPALLSSWILVYIFTTREIGAAILLYGPRSMVLSVLTWDYLFFGNLQNAAIIGLFQTVMLLIGIAVARWVFRVKLSSAR